MREKSAAANPVRAPALRTERPRSLQRRDDAGRQDGLGLFQVRVGIAEVAKHVAAPLDRFEVAVAHGLNSRLSRANRRRIRSISVFGVPIPVFDFFLNAWITQSRPASSVT